MSAPHVPQVPTWRGDAAFSNLCKTFLLLPPPWCELAKAQPRLEEGGSLPALSLLLHLGTSAHGAFPAVAEITFRDPYRDRSENRDRPAAFVGVGVPPWGMTAARGPCWAFWHVLI